MVFVVDKLHVPSKSAAPTRCLGDAETVVVPVSVVNRLLISRGRLPDHAIRPTIKAADGDEKLFAMLTIGLLVIRKRDFDLWYRSQRAKGKWASQWSRKKTGDGRPTKQTNDLRTAVLALVRGGDWTGKAGIATLRRLLVSRSDVPSRDTLARLVDQLHRETGDAGLVRIARTRRKRPQ